MEDKPQEKPQRNRGHRDNKNEYRERRDKRDNRERRPYRADIEAAEASANETNEVNAANAGRENKDGYKKPYKGGKNRPNKQKYNRNKDYKNKTIIKITTGTKTMEALIHSNERLDDLCRKGYRLIQDPKLFCFGIDAVLLSDYAKVKRGERAVDFVHRKRCDSDTSEAKIRRALQRARASASVCRPGEKKCEI